MMFTTLDRMLLINYLRNYVIVLTSLLSLYIVIDLFTNLDDFSKGGFWDNLSHISAYYSTRVTQIFDRLAEAMSLIAAVFTLAWLQRNNELLPQLSAGVSARRVVRPVVFGALLTVALGTLNQEFVIPTIADELSTARDDPDNQKATLVKGAFDSTGVHIEGFRGFRREQKVEWMFVTFPEAGPSGLAHLTARQAVYVPPVGREPQPLTGGWMLYEASPLDNPLPANLTQLEYGNQVAKYFLKTNETDFDTITRPANWYVYASTPRLRELLAKPDSKRQPAVATTFHMRLTRPVVGLLLVLMGLAVILRDQNRHVFISVGLCLILAGVFYALMLGCKYLGEADIVAPALAAWLPVLVFGPLTLSLFDAVHT